MILWQPSPERKKNSQLTRFIAQASIRAGRSIASYEELYEWSLSNNHDFWREVWSFCDVRSSTPPRIVHRPPSPNNSRFPIPRGEWFPETKLNFAENLLRFRDDHTAIVFWGENKVRKKLSYRDLFEQVQTLSAYLRSCGVVAGDRVAGFMPNMPETIVAMLATASIGAIWSSCSPDFGEQGVLDRFGQIAPKILFTADGYYFKDQTFDSLEKVARLLPRIPSIERVVVVSYAGSKTASPPSAVSFEKALTTTSMPLNCVQLPFDHPLVIMYSSGTTGVPKCIVHSAGGALLEILKEHVLHTDLKRSDRFFYQTTCGWMMWNWLVNGLAVGATLVLFDGAPFAREGKILFDLAQEEQVTIFGTNAKYLASCEKEGLAPRTTHDLRAIHTLLSTGSPLSPESFDYVYREISSDLCLSSISGGTDILGCFALGCPLLPVTRGELQCRSLGMAVKVFDDQGEELCEEKGELVCANPFPSMPVSFWNDSSGERYFNAYFARFPGVWHHGDYVELKKNGGVIMHGRSDAVLNPGGIRIGTAEIYRQVEQIEEVVESIAIGQDWKNDVRVVLFVRLAPNTVLTEELAGRIKKIIRENTTPFHVPKKIVAVDDIPRTRSGKIVELAVREVVHGREVKNKEALLNPEALLLFENIPVLRTD